MTSNGALETNSTNRPHDGVVDRHASAAPSVASAAARPLALLRLTEYDHSYSSVSTFMADHL